LVPACSSICGVKKSSLSLIEAGEKIENAVCNNLIFFSTEQMLNSQK